MRRMRSEEMMTLGVMRGARMSMTGERVSCSGSRTPQRLIRGGGEDAFALSSVDNFFGVPASPFRRLTLAFSFDDVVAARERDLTPALSALTRSVA